MDPNVREWLNMIFRWAHVVAGILWIGHLYFFNFVNSQVAKTYDAESKKKVVPELMPRALYWFRWGAAYTWITGILLLGLVIYMDAGVIVPAESSLGSVTASIIGLAILVIGFLVYDVLWKSMAKNEQAGVIVSYVLILILLFVMSRIFSGRATYIQLGATFGTIMAGNVWMRIWPSQRKIIAAAKGGPAVDPAVVAMAGLRSKQNLVFTMVSNHFPTIYGSDFGWVILAILVLVGFGVTKLLYNKAASPTPAQF